MVADVDWVEHEFDDGVTMNCEVIALAGSVITFDPFLSGGSDPLFVDRGLL